MKKAALYLFVAIVSASCNQGNENPFNQQKNNNTSSNWSKDYTTKFISDCVNSASGELGNQKAQAYCSCMADKISKKYPNENDANKLTKEDIETLKGGCLGNQTNNNQNNNPNNNQNQNNPNNNQNQNQNQNQYNPNNNQNQNQNQKQWSNDDQKAFLQGCVTLAIKRMDGGSATQYCDCIMQKLMQKYPSREAANNAYTQEYNNQLDKECGGTGTTGSRKY